MRLLFLLLMISCGEHIEISQPNLVDEQGVDGTSAAFSELIISVDRSATPWQDNNLKEASGDMLVYLPSSFEFTNLTSTENGGWIDIVLDKQRFCYQGKFGTRIYEYKYKKVESHTEGCDKNNEKFIGSVQLQGFVKNKKIIQIIPRAPRLDGVYNELTLITLGVFK